MDGVFKYLSARRPRRKVRYPIGVITVHGSDEAVSIAGRGVVDSLVLLIFLMGSISGGIHL